MFAASGQTLDVTRDREVIEDVEAYRVATLRVDDDIGMHVKAIERCSESFRCY